MSGPSSKRQQARNERALQELIKNVPGNNVCADCQARNPGWASWSLGIFLCMRCAALHRKLGTHISKVKSLSMDSWSTEQVENMKRTGNIASNRIYNPQNTRPPVPFDADEADAAMERFIRQKYMENGGRAQTPARHNTGSTESDDNPPPLPPKGNSGKSSRFGFRSASSIFPMSSKAKREAAATAHLESSRERQRSPSPPIRNKPSRIFGATAGIEVSNSTVDDLDKKLAKLRDMGFTDEKRNTTVLKGLNGNLEKAVESLVRLGGTSGPASRSRTPLSATAGISIQRTRDKESPDSSNPFDMPLPSPAMPQSSQSTGTLAHGQQTNGNPYHYANNANPFGLAPSQSQYNLHQQYALDQSFQNLSINQSQPLFPNHTGGFPNRQPIHSAPTSPLNPMPTIPQQYAAAVYDSQFQQSPVQQNQNSNPFMLPQAGTFNVAADYTFSTNPYAVQQRAQTYPQQNPLYQPQQQQQSYFDPNQPMQNQQQASLYQPAQQANNPYNSQNQQLRSPQQPPQPQQYQQVQQSSNPYNTQFQQNQQDSQSQQQYMQYHQGQQLASQQTGRADKSSILALYNYPRLTPVAQNQILSSVDQNQSQDNNAQGFPGAAIPAQQAGNVSNPLAAYTSGSRNPFLSSGGAFGQGGNTNGVHAPIDVNGLSGGGQLQGQGQGQGQTRHVSQESVSNDSGGWYGQNGRHSPDAFANLSARSMR